MRKHEHGQIIGIGVGDVQMLAVNIYSRRETTLVNDLDQFVGNGLRSQTGAMESRPSLESESEGREARYGTYAASHVRELRKSTWNGAR